MRYNRKHSYVSRVVRYILCRTCTEDMPDLYPRPNSRNMQLARIRIWLPLGMPLTEDAGRLSLSDGPERAGQDRPDQPDQIRAQGQDSRDGTCFIFYFPECTSCVVHNWQWNPKPASQSRIYTYCGRMPWQSVGMHSRIWHWRGISFDGEKKKRNSHICASRRGVHLSCSWPKYLHSIQYLISSYPVAATRWLRPMDRMDVVYVCTWTGRWKCESHRK